MIEMGPHRPLCDMDLSTSNAPHSPEGDLEHYEVSDRKKEKEKEMKRMIIAETKHHIEDTKTKSIVELAADALKKLERAKDKEWEDDEKKKKIRRKISFSSEY